MRYNIRKILCSTSLSLALSVMASGKAFAQADVLFDEEAPALETNDFPLEEAPMILETPAEEVSLFDDNAAAIDESHALIAPPAPVVETKAEEIIMQDEEPIAILGTAPATGYAPLGAPSGISYSEPEMGDVVLNKIGNDLFAQMSDLEKQTALLTLELRREKIKSEIEALRIQRAKAAEEEQTAKEEKERKRIEWEKEQEKKLIEEQMKLREIEMSLEKLKQGRVINAYKENMLEENQKWVANNEKIYQELNKTEKERDDLKEDFKSKLAYITTMAQTTASEAKTARENFIKEKENLQTQLSVVKARLEAAEQGMAKATAANAFPGSVPISPESLTLSDDYAIMEIKGQGEDLSAKLINKEGAAFMVKKGTTLSSGHIIDEITKTYVRGDKGGRKDYIYFSAGGVLDNEPSESVVENYVKKNAPTAKNTDVDAKKSSRPALVTTRGVPSLNEGMFVR